MNQSPDQPPGVERSGEFISHAEEDDSTAGEIDLKEVRYSMPVMLEELRMERRTGMFAMEILDQGEIERIFESRRRTHGKAD
ncbi:MAG TPA: hypothetical protein VMM36_05020 [Opitutaceae bacterium]|nr:hypothetical protein [Opitutaceae bacterium]